MRISGDELGKMVRKYRRDRYTQQELANIVGVSRRTIIRIEQGHAPKPWIIKLLRLHGVI